jgi:hypothetical protein
MTNAEQRQYEWTARIRDYRASGLTMSAWCEAQGLTLHQLKYWLRKIDSSQPRSSSPSFIPVTVSPRSSPSALTLHIGPASLDVQAGFSPELLRQVVQALSTYVDATRKGLFSRRQHGSTQIHRRPGRPGSGAISARSVRALSVCIL